MGHKPFVQERSSHRPAKFAQRVKEELATLIPGDLRDPRIQGVGFLTITSVTVTPDLKHGTVLFALMGDETKARDVEAGLNQASGFLRRELMHRLDTKITPQLVFKYDRGLENISVVSTLLKKT